jgi:hypothetical protein
MVDEKIVIHPTPSWIGYSTPTNGHAIIRPLNACKRQSNERKPLCGHAEQNLKTDK